MQNGNHDSRVPWWKFGHVWLVLAGPAIVVIASFVTFYIAVTRPDPVVTEDYYRKGIEINKTSENAIDSASLAPAIQARNHAATGVVPTTKADIKP
jgi:hypothetical protein